MVQNFHGSTARRTTRRRARRRSIPGGPVASQEAIKEIGTNGGGPYNANSAHPFENPNPITNMLEIWLLLAIPFAFPWTFGRWSATSDRAGRLRAMFVAVVGSRRSSRSLFEANGNPKLDRGVEPRRRSGGNMEGKEVRFGAAASGLFAASTTGRRPARSNAPHDSFTPLGGAVPLVNMMLGEVVPGGVGSGLYGMLDLRAARGVHRRA